MMNYFFLVLVVETAWVLLSFLLDVVVTVAGVLADAFADDFAAAVLV